MPIGAFQSVRQGTVNSALVPSLYALRANETDTFLRIPREGALLIPSYLCARTSIPVSIARRIAEAILYKEMCEFYAAQGDLIVFPAYTAQHSRQEGDKYILPAAEWLSALDSEEFYRMYKKYLPTCSMQ